MRLLLFAIAFLFISHLAIGQEDLTGTWEGGGGPGCEYATLTIIKHKNTYIGFTYDEGDGYCKCHFVGEYDPAKKKLKGVNRGVIKKTFLHAQSRYNLNYENIHGVEYLRGSIAPKTILLPIPQSIRYTRTTKKVDTTDFMRTWLLENTIQSPADITEHDKPVNAPVDSVKTIEKPIAAVADTLEPVAVAPIPTAGQKIITEKNKRTNDTLSVINTSATELVIKVMDNGIVDGDTVSIIHNGRVIAERISVKAAAHEIKIPIDNQNKHQEIVLVAHNLGSISPNTALIVIETPEKQYRLTASTDLSKNAMIIFRYKQ